MDEQCAYCQRAIPGIGHVPCQGRHSMRAHAQAGDAVCAEQVVKQGWSNLGTRVPPATEERFGSFGK